MENSHFAKGFLYKLTGAMYGSLDFFSKFFTVFTARSASPLD